MKESRSPGRQQSEGADAPAGWGRAPRPARVALLAAVMLLALAGVSRDLAGGPAAAQKRAPAFKYSYRVVEVQLYGVFLMTSTMGRRGEDVTFNGKEEIWVLGTLKGNKTQGDLLKELFISDDQLAPLVVSKTFAEGTLSLQNPASEMGVNGMLQTSDFKRDFIIKGAGVDSDGKNFSCGETLADAGGFVGVMRLSGSEKVKVYWVLPGVSYKCGPVTVDYNDQHRLKRVEGDPAISSADDPNQEAQTYPLSAFRQKRFTLNIDIAHSWEPDYATKANVVWKGKVWLERIESGKEKR